MGFSGLGVSYRIWHACAGNREVFSAIATLVAEHQRQDMNETLKGQCLCGNIQFTVKEPFHHFYFCHCSQCQKSTGSAHAANLFGPVDAVTWLAGEEKIRRYELSPSSYFNKSLCVDCGSPVPGKAKSGDFMIIPAGCLEANPEIKPAANIYWGDRSAWYDDGCRAPRFEAAEYTAP